jgi:maleylacetate reductase
VSDSAQRIVFTDDLVDALRTSLSRCGAARVLVITGSSRRFVDHVAAAAAGLEVEVFDGARVHVPSEVVSAASVVARRFGPDAMVSLGGGSATGLGKALRLDLEVPFIAVPTTYSESERTTVYGITTGTDKKTGRDPRVRPDEVIYAPPITVGIPVKLTVQSLLNALAHPISALSTGALGAALEVRALEAIGVVVTAVGELALEPARLDSRRRAFEGTALAGDIIEAGILGPHHQIAHFLGGHFGLDHAALHSVLLVQTISALLASRPEILAAIEDAAGRRPLARALFDLLEGAGAETSLAALFVSRAALETALAERTDLPRALVLSAFDGVRP